MIPLEGSKRIKTEAPDQDIDGFELSTKETEVITIEDNQEFQDPTNVIKDTNPLSPDVSSTPPSY